MVITSTPSAKKEKRKKKPMSQVLIHREKEEKRLPRRSLEVNENEMDRNQQNVWLEVFQNIGEIEPYESKKQYKTLQGINNILIEFPPKFLCTKNQIQYGKGVTKIGRYNFKITCSFSQTCSLHDGFASDNKHTQTPHQLKI